MKKNKGKKRLLIYIFILVCIISFQTACGTIEMSDIPEGTVFYDSDSLQILYYKKFQLWQNMQGGAIYKDKLICLMATDEMEGETVNGFIYDLKSGCRIANLYFSSKMGDIFFAKPHANQVSFGKKFYSRQSEFPLLYVSQVNGGRGAYDIFGERGVLVYDITKDKKGFYHPNLVQVIMPDLEDEALMDKLGKYTPNYIVDTIKQQLIVIGYPDSSWFKLDGPQPIAVLDLPTCTKKEGEQVVKFRNENVLDNYRLDRSLGIQQSFIKNNTLYTSCGMHGNGAIRIVDLQSKQVKKVYRLSTIMEGEPQFFGVWRGRYLFYEAGTGGQFYEFKFK